MKMSPDTKHVEDGKRAEGMAEASASTRVGSQGTTRSDATPGVQPSDKPDAKTILETHAIAGSTNYPSAPYGRMTPLPEQGPQIVQVLPVLLDFGEALMLSGADVHSIEESIQRLGIAYGAYKMNVLVITTSIIVTATLDDGYELTQTRRIEDDADNDFDKLERYTRLCRNCIKTPLPPDVLQAKLMKIKQTPLSKVKFFISGLLCTSSFAIFFGGTWLDGVVSAAFSVLVCIMMLYLRPLTPNTIVFDFLASLICGAGICVAAHLADGFSVAMVTVGVIMLLIPGVAMTSAIRDMISGDTVSGTMRLVESCLWATSLALGFMAAMWIFGIDGEGVNSNADPLVQLISAIFGSIGFALFFNVRNGLVFVCTLGGFLTEGVYLLVGTTGLGIVENLFMTVVVASVFAAVYAEILARTLHAPTTVFFIISVIPLIPGRGLYYTMQCAVQQNWSGLSEFAMITFQTALGIAVGIVIVWAFVQTVRNIQRKL